MLLQAIFLVLLLVLLVGALYLVFANQRYIRVKAIISMIMAGFAGPPAVSVTSQWFNVKVESTPLTICTMLLGLAGVAAMTVLEVRATRQHIFGATLEALIQYQELRSSSAPKEVRLKFVRGLRGRPDVDVAVSEIILAAELAG